MAFPTYVTSINGMSGSYPFRTDPKRMVDAHDIGHGAGTISSAMQDIAEDIQPLVLTPGQESGDFILGLGAGGFQYSETN